MKDKQKQAQSAYDSTVIDLRVFCENYTDLTPVIIEDNYPIKVQFIPNTQMSIFENDNVDENGEINDLTITVGLNTSVKSTLKFKMDSKLLKKLIKLAEKLGDLYYHAFREKQGERITRLRPFMKAMDGFDASEASILVCPGCEHPVVNQWARGTQPAFCQGCGQALDWTLAPETEKKENATREDDSDVEEI